MKNWFPSALIPPHFPAFCRFLFLDSAPSRALETGLGDAPVTSFWLVVGPLA